MLSSGGPGPGERDWLVGWTVGRLVDWNGCCRCGSYIMTVVYWFHFDSIRFGFGFLYRYIITQDFGLDFRYQMQIDKRGRGE